MNISKALAKYVGGELAEAGGKGVSKVASSKLTNLLSSAVEKASAKTLSTLSKVGEQLPAVAQKADGPTRAVKTNNTELDVDTPKALKNAMGKYGATPNKEKATRTLASGVKLKDKPIPLFRGQKNRLDRLDYNKGKSPTTNGFYMTPTKEKTDSWNDLGVVSVEANPEDIMTLKELQTLKKDADRYFTDPKYQVQLYNTDPELAEIYDALVASDNYQELSRLTGKPFIELDSGQGTELGEIVYMPDTKPELTSRYNADLAAGKNQWLSNAQDEVVPTSAFPSGTKIKFGDDLGIKAVELPKEITPDKTLDKVAKYLPRKNNR